jgi:hypothetical protein
MLIAVFVSFSPTFYLRAFVAEAARFPIAGLYLYVHGLIMTAWYVLFFVQGTLTVSSRIRAHRRLGRVGALLAVAVVLSGAYVSLKMPSHFVALGLPPEVQMGVGLGITIGNLVTLTAFVAVIGAALLLRRQAPWHGRLMFWSFALTLGPVLGNPTNRLGARLIEPLVPQWLPNSYLILLVCFVALSLYDLTRTRRIHLATIVGAVVFVVTIQAHRAIMQTEAARAFVEWLL